MRLRFAPLGIQIYGTQRFNDNYFFQEGPQAEEGKDFEAQLWGNTVSLTPIFEQVTNLSTCLVAYSWPSSHSAPDLQHPFVDRSFYAPYARGDYTGFLLHPPAPTYTQERPLEVENYARLLRESWWQSEFQRFAHQALKMVPQRNALVMLPEPHPRLVYTQLQQELSKADCDIVMQSYARLSDVKQTFLAAWLWEKTEALVTGRATIIRIKFEARTWHATYARINNQIDKSINDIREICDSINGWLVDSIAGRLTDDVKQTITSSLDQAAATFVSNDLMELSRLVRHSVQYAQALIAIYFLVPKQQERRILHQQYMKPLRVHLSTVRDKLGTLMQRLDGFVTAVSGLDAGQVFLRPLLERLRDYVVDFQAVARVNRASLQDMIWLLADELVAPGLDYSRHPDALPAVPEARKRLAMIASLERAAVRSLGFLLGEERNRVTEVVETWMFIISRASAAQPGIAEVDDVVGGDARIPPTGLAGVGGNNSDDSDSGEIL